MASAAQINANRLNAQHSTGPRTEAGKAASSLNHLTLGLYTRQDYVKPEERDLYKEFCDTMYLELAPEGLLEQSLTGEITGATWRLRRCNAAEGALGGFDDATDKTRRSIERARASAHSVLHRSVNQLRKLRTERKTAIDLDVVAESAAQNKGDAPFRRVVEDRSAPNCKATPAPAPITQPTPRNAPCPCHSGEKFKRCCGRNALPVLGKAA